MFSYYIVVVKRLMMMTKAAAEMKKLKKALLAIHPIRSFEIAFLLSLVSSFSKKEYDVCWLCCILVVKFIYISIILCFELFLTC